MKWIKHFLLIINIVACVNGLTQSPKEDTIFVNDLLEKSKTLLNDDPAKAIRAAEQALAVATKIDFLKANYGMRIMWNNKRRNP